MADIRATFVEHIQCSHAALDAAKAQMDKQAATAEAAHALIPAVVEALVRHDRIDPAQREKAAEALKDPVRVLEILLKTADAASTTRPPALGTPAAGTEKKASGPRYPGEKTAALSQADEAFARAILG